jgi:putative ATP-binding cassette transporter
MEFFLYLLKSSKKIVLTVALAGLFSGGFSAGLIAIINGALHGNPSDYNFFLLGFVLFFLGKLGMHIISRMLLIRFSAEKIRELSHRISEMVTQTPLVRLEELGKHRIYTVLTGDVHILGAAILAIPTLTMNLAVLIGCASYLLWLSPMAFLAVIVLFLVGSLGYKLLREKAFKAIFSAREERDQLFKTFRTLTEGIKELQMSQVRIKHFLKDHLHNVTGSLVHHNIRAANLYLMVDSWNQFLFYAMIGYLLFLSPVFSTMPTETLTGFIFASLYMMNPMFGLIGSIPTFVAGQVSLKKIEDLGTTLTEPLTAKKNSSFQGDSLPFEGLELKGVTFSYQSKEGQEKPFQLGPFDFSLQPGELVFVIGGNGSGKSTFVKILTGLYSPQGGQFILNGKVMTEEELGNYRELYSAVFSPSYVFEHLLGQTGPGVDNRAQAFLEQLHLEKIIQIENGKLSTIDVSQGQRKRLAMLSVLMEDHPIFVFDEWAADQDPHYKEIFYTELLPRLKKRGKAIVVITHDDRYFSLGDRIIKFDYGQIVSNDNAYSWSNP